MHFYRLLTRVFSIVLFISNLLFSGVVYGQLDGDCRSARTGYWHVAANWEVYNGQDWVVASTAPDKKSGVITIRDGHTITILYDTYIDQTIVENAGVIVLDCEPTRIITNLYVVDGPGLGPDLLIKGTLINKDGMVINQDVPNNVTGTVEFAANSTYNHNKNGGYIPIATWDIASTCLVTGYANSQMDGFNQTFGNFTWDCSNQGTLAFLFPVSGMSIAGNFSVNKTGSTGNLEFHQREISIAGDLIINGGILRIGVTRSNLFNTSTYNVKGDLMVSGGTLNITGNNSGIINVAGNFSYQGGTITTNNNTKGGNIVFNGTQPQVYSTGSGVSISNKINFTVNSGAILQFADENTFISGTGFFKLLENATLGITSPAGITLTGATGNIRVSGVRTYDQRANYIYNGHNPQRTGNGLSASINLTINNAAEVTLSQQVNVNGVLTLTNGQLTTRIITTTPETVNLLILNDGATVSGGSSASFVNGPVKKVGDEKFIFPVGKNGNYMPVEMSSPSNATDAFTAEYFSVSPPNLESIPSQGLLKISNCEYWTLDRSSESSNVNVTLKWDKYKDCNGEEFFNDPLTIVIAHYKMDNNSWNIHGGNGVGYENGGSVTWEQVPEYGILTFGKTSPSNPLPVKFSSVKAFEKPTGIQVEFTNLTESDVSYYEIERSAGGQVFYPVKRLAPSKNDYSSASYSWLDVSCLEGMNVYRVKAVETTGKSVYSNLVSITSINNRSGNNGLEVFVKGREVISRINNLPAGKYCFHMVNMSGQIVHTENITHGGGALIHSTLLNNANAGIYIYDVQGPVQLQKKFLVR